MEEGDDQVEKQCNKHEDRDRKSHDAASLQVLAHHGHSILPFYRPYLARPRGDHRFRYGALSRVPRLPIELRFRRSPHVSASPGSRALLLGSKPRAEGEA